MADAFDPYHKWLGIPPQDQPPHHYRLLGIAIFESDPDVIDAAASKQAAYLQSCAAGPHVAQSQQLLGEIATARLCLLSAEKKRAYDAMLCRAMATAAAPVDRGSPLAAPAAGTSAVAASRPVRKRFKVTSGQVVQIGAAVFASMVLIGIFIFSKGAPPDTENHPVAETKANPTLADERVAVTSGAKRGPESKSQPKEEVLGHEPKPEPKEGVAGPEPKSRPKEVEAPKAIPSAAEIGAIPAPTDTITAPTSLTASEENAQRHSPGGAIGPAPAKGPDSAQPAAIAQPGPGPQPETEPQRVAKTKPKSKAKSEPKEEITAEMVRKKFHAPAKYLAKTHELTLEYDFKKRGQLSDFEGTPAWKPGVMGIAVGESARHIAKFKSVDIAGMIAMNSHKGVLVRCTGGLEAYRGGTLVKIKVNNDMIEDGQNGPADAVRVLPFQIKLSDKGMSFRLGGKVVGTERRQASWAGQVEFCGGEAGTAFSRLVISGEIDSQWAEEFFKEPK